MTGPETPDMDMSASPAPSCFQKGSFSDGGASGSTVKPEMIKKRRDFLAAARARRWVARGMLLQGRQRREGEDAASEAVRVGYTRSKKVGGAVIRNRAKRRLRAAAAEVLPTKGRPGWDYVLIGKAGQTVERGFADLVADLETALDRVHEPKRR